MDAGIDRGRDESTETLRQNSEAKRLVWALRDSPPLHTHSHHQHTLFGGGSLMVILAQ
jgi:hypothetical protein